MIRLMAVIDRDFKKFRRNPVVLAMSIFMPVLYLIILGNSFQGKLRHVPVVVVNQDPGTFSTRMLENLRAVEAGPRTLTLESAADPGTAIEGVRTGRYKAALIIPTDFSKRVIADAKPEIGLFLDNTDGISSEAIRSVAAGAIRYIRSEYESVRQKPDEIMLRDISLYRQVDYNQSLVPGVVIMAIFLGALTTGAFNLVMDRFLGVDESYLLTPLTQLDIVAGLILSGLVITTFIAGIIFTVSIAITGISFSQTFSHTPALFLIVILTTLSLQSLMFVILGRIHHPRIVGILSGFMNVILFFPSGAVYPISSFPGWLRTFAKINPEAYAVRALKSVIFKGADVQTILTDIGFLSVFTAIMMSAAIISFKRTL